MEQDEEAGDMWQKKPLMVFGKPGFSFIACNLKKLLFIHPKYISKTLKWGFWSDFQTEKFACFKYAIFLRVSIAS